MNWLRGVSLLILFECIADILAKEYSIRGTWPYWVAAIGGYIIANIFWLWGIKDGSGLARGAVIFSVGSEILAIALGIFLYKEKIDHYQILGIIFGFVSLTFFLIPK